MAHVNLRFPVALKLLAAALVATALCERPAVASSIFWQYDIRVHGTVVGTPSSGGGPINVDVPIGTQLTINLAFDPGSPNVCPDPTTQGGVYLVGSGNSNTATLDFLGYRYDTFGGIEVGLASPCGSNGTASGLRLFTGAASLIAPTGVLVHWLPRPTFGSMFIGGPDAAGLGLIPTTLPWDPFPTWANLSIGSVQLTVESAQISAVPEPSSGLLVLSAIVILAATRHRSRSRRVGTLATGNRP